VRLFRGEGNPDPQIAVAWDAQSGNSQGSIVAKVSDTHPGFAVGMLDHDGWLERQRPQSQH